MLTREEEYRLIRQWQDNGCERSRREMYDAFLNMLKKQAAKRKHLEFDDALQMASIGFIQAMDTFDASMGKRFSTHLAWQIRAQFPSRKDMRRIKNRFAEVTTLDAPLGDDSDMTHKDALVDPTSPDYDGNTVRSGLGAAVSRLTERERIIALGVAHGVTFERIAGLYGVTRQAIQGSEVRVMRKMRTMIPKGYRYYLEDTPL